MKLFPDSTTFIQIGPLEIKWYAVFILSGALIAFQFIKSNLKKKNYPSNLVEDLFIGSLLSGILGSRLWYVAFSDPLSYLSDPMRIFNFQEGGLAIHGGLVFGVIFAWFFLRKKGYHFLETADEAMYPILLAQAIGRWGNFINKEAFGPAISQSSISWLPKFVQDGMFVDGAYHMPTFLYESMANIVGFLLIHYVLRRVSKLKRGDLAYSYLMWYGIVRFFIEIFRTDALLIGGGEIKIAQVTSIAFILIGALGYLGVFRKLFPIEKPTLIFDFDGTLMDTHEVIVSTFKEVFNTVETTHELSDEDYDWVVGPSLKQSFERFVVNPDTDALINQYREIMIEKHKELADQMPGAVEMLKELKEQGYKIGIFSNKKTDMVQMGMNQVNMTPYIDVVIGGDLFDEPKPNPQGIYHVLDALNGYRDNLVMIGDSAGDIQSGMNAHAYTIAYTANEKRKQELLNLKPNAAVDSLSDIPMLLRKEQLWNQLTN